MAYTKYKWDNLTWEKGQAFFQNQLNHIEEGVEEASKGAGKIWHTVELGEEELETLENNGEVFIELEKEYDPTNFANEYVQVDMDITGASEGELVAAEEEISNIRFDVTTDDWQKYFFDPKEAQYVFINLGFEWNYYKTVVLYAGCDKPEGEEPYVHTAGVEGNNVVYLQDVTQQQWEHIDESIDSVENEIVKEVKEGKERLETTLYGGAYVISIKGGANVARVAYLLNYSDTQAAYWNSTKSDIGWADIEAGKIYKVTFDTEHNSARWLLTMTDDGHPVEITPSEKTALYNTGINFDADKYAADTLFDEENFIKAPVLGNGNSDFCYLISINGPFKEPTSRYIVKVIARPAGFFLSAYTDDKGVLHQGGEYVWGASVEGLDLSMCVFKDDMETLVIAPANINETTYTTDNLYRHTFTITKATDASLGTNHDLAISFCAVNCQAGDSSMEYILHSDERGQSADWILPCSGVIGINDGAGNFTYHTAVRIVAGYNDNEKRTLYVDYLNESTHQLSKTAVIDDENKYLYYARDFISLLTDFAKPETQLKKK